MPTKITKKPSRRIRRYAVKCTDCHQIIDKGEEYTIFKNMPWHNGCVRLPDDFGKDAISQALKQAGIESRLIAFARWAIEEHRSEFGYLDDCSIQDKLEDLGLLQRVEVKEPCGEHCWCAEYNGEFPAECLRLVDGVKEGG